VAKTANSLALLKNNLQETAMRRRTFLHTLAFAATVFLADAASSFCATTHRDYDYNRRQEQQRFDDRRRNDDIHRQELRRFDDRRREDRSLIERNSLENQRLEDVRKQRQRDDERRRMEMLREEDLPRRYEQPRLDDKRKKPR
jgi:hypothetical protein